MSSKPVTRREFVTVASQVAAAAALFSLSPSAALAAGRRRFAIVGTGSRACGMWGAALLKRFPDLLEFVGLCDINPKRAEVAKRKMGVECPTFTDFDKMCDQVKPEVLLIATVDATHAGYIVKGLDRGIDVITEKPMVTDEHQCRAVLDAEKRSGRKIIVAFNFRYPPIHRKMKELLLAGEIGKIVSVDYNYFLNRDHGGSYFHRWHALKSKSGSLLCHKSSHHFDLLNWLLGADPEEISAQGEIKMYGKQGPFRHTHCRPCPHKAECPFYYDITKDREGMELYAACESEDGYLRDACVFRDEVDSYDTMSVLIKYAGGIIANYSLNTFMPYEGSRIAINGLKGRLELRHYIQQSWKVDDEHELYLTRENGKQERISAEKGEGGHGGGDDFIRDLVFRPAEVPAHLRLPDSRAGAMSCLTGVAARKSIEEKRPVKIADLM